MLLEYGWYLEVYNWVKLSMKWVKIMKRKITKVLPWEIPNLKDWEDKSSHQKRTEKKWLVWFRKPNEESVSRIKEWSALQILLMRWWKPRIDQGISNIKVTGDLNKRSFGDVNGTREGLKIWIAQTCGQHLKKEVIHLLKLDLYLHLRY